MPTKAWAISSRTKLDDQEDDFDPDPKQESESPETAGAGYSKCHEFQTDSGIISQMKAR